MAKRYSEKTIINCAKRYRQESDTARRWRMDQNRINYDTYHLRQDFSYKLKGQSTEFLPKASMAVEQSANFLQQGLTDIGQWFRVEPEEGMTEDLMKIKPSEIQRVLERHLKKCGFTNKIGDALKLGLIGSLMIVKVHGKECARPMYRVKNTMKGNTYAKQLVKVEDKYWELAIDTVRQEDFYPDPTGKGLYVMEDCYVDYYDLLRQAEAGVYDLEAVQKIKGMGSEIGLMKDYNKNRETNQMPTNSGYRHRVKVTEIWGNILDDDGELVHENVVCTVANDNWVIRKPTPNPLWHGEHPYVFCPILRVPNGVWGKALMDAPSMLNRAINEMFNLILDGGIMSVHGIKQIREHWLEDQSQVSDGIQPGISLRVNSSCPPGAQVLERVDTATIPQDSLPVYNIINQEFTTAALTNDLRLGAQPFRAVKATEVVEASQTISAMFAGIAKQIEIDFIEKILDKSWKTIAQHIDDLDENYMEAVLGSKRWGEISNISNEELFAETVGKCVFRVFGVSATLNKQKDFTKLQGMLQTVTAVPQLTEEFMKKYSMTKLLEEILRALDINTYKLEADKNEGGNLQGQQAQGQSVGPDMQSQIPQAGAAGNQTDLKAETNIPSTSFPESRATPKGV